MYQGIKVGCAIPARIGSTRFPKKVLADLLGKPLLAWVVEAAKSISFWDHLVVLVDDEEVADLCVKLNVPYLMTPKERQNGTERLSLALGSLPSSIDVWTLWQADEPLVTQALIESLLSSIENYAQSIWTLCAPIESEKDFFDPSVVKVVCNHESAALYFSRAPIPYPRDGQKIKACQHVGLYAYRKSFLERYPRLPRSFLEELESLEQLRYLAAGEKITVHKTAKALRGVNLKEDLSEIKLTLAASLG